MPQASTQEIPQAVITLLQVLGVTSLAGTLAFWSAWLAFPPELVVESISDKSKKFHSESRIKIKNIGKLPASAITCSAENVCMEVGGNRMVSGTLGANPIDIIHRLAGGETAETTVTPGIMFGSAAQAKHFSYTLLIEYETKFFRLRKKFSKRWLADLRVFEDGFSWNVTPKENSEITQAA